MGISLAQIASNTASVTFQWEGEQISLDYYPGRVTEKVFARINAFASMDQSTVESGFSGFNEMLANLLKAWNVFEDEEQTVMFPIKAERFPDLPVYFRLEALQAIMGDIRPEALTPQK